MSFEFKMRWMSVLLLLGMLLGAVYPAAALPQADLAVPSAAPASDQSQPPDSSAKIEPALAKELESGGQVDFFIWLAEKADLSPADKLTDKTAKGKFVYETLVETAERSQKELRATLDSLGVEYRAYYIANKILVRSGTLSLLTSLAERPDVYRLTANHFYQLEKPETNPKAVNEILEVGDNLTFVNADQVWALGILGQGVVLAGNDTGLDWEHPAIQPHYRGWDGMVVDHNYNWWDATGTYPMAPADGFGHGTHTTGTMVGDDDGTNQIGIAPGSLTIHCKNMDDFGGGYDATFIECFQWDLAPWDLNGQNPRPDLAPDAINNSWGYGGGNYPEFEDEIAALQAAGILVEVSAGNEGPSCSTLRSPGDYSGVLTTGSVNHAVGPLPGTLTDFSSRGPSLLSSEFLPNVMAPGENIRSSVPGGGYENWYGTSMAGPHVTGLIGLLWDANPGLRGLVAETQQIIFSTSIPLSGQTGSNCGGDYDLGPNNDWGYGTIDALAAVQAAMSFGGVGTLQGSVTDSSNTDPLEGAAISAALNADLIWRMRSNAAGEFSRLVFSGTYTVTAELYGYYPDIATGIEVISGTTTVHDIAMDPAPTYQVSGQVTDAATGWPLYARIDIGGYPYGPVFTDPLTGEYSIELAAGLEYTFRVTAWVDGYNTAVRPVGPLAAPAIEDFSLVADPLLCSAPGYLPDYIYFEDFEDDDGGFTVDGTTSWEWGSPTSGPRSAHSGLNVWATNLSGDYFNNEFGSITSPMIDLSTYSGQTIIVSWWQWLQTEADFDYGWVEVSSDGGSSWQQIYFDTGEVNTTWTKYSIVLDPSFAVGNFLIRFYFSSEGSVTAPGYYVDDIGIGVQFAPPPYYAEDFESDDGGYTVSGVTSWEWGIPTRGPSFAHSGSYVWATNLDDNYGNNEDGYLTSPPVDLSSADTEMMQLSWWQWLQTERGYDFASVEVSDGITWTEIYSFTGVINPLSAAAYLPAGGGGEGSYWYQYTYLLDAATYAVPDFQVRFRLQSDATVTYPGYYLDDVRVDPYTGLPPAVGCEAQSGGLVLGSVFDENTGTVLNGASISGPAGMVFSQATEDDPAVVDGFYVTFAPPGPQALSASLVGYGEIIETPVVSAGGVVWQDFNLPAGWLTATPTGLQANLAMGMSQTLSLDLENLGGLAAAFEFRERAGEYFPASLPVTRVSADPQQDFESEPGGTYTSLGSWTGEPRPEQVYTPPSGARFSASGTTVLLVFAYSASQIQSMLQAYPDLAVVDYFDGASGTPDLAQLQAYDVVVVGANFGFADPVALGNVLADYIDGGGNVIQTVPTFYDPGGSGWGIQGRYLDEGYSPFIGAGDWFTWSDLGSYDSSHPIMEGVSSAGDYFRQMVDLSADAEWVASWMDDEFIASKGNVVALNTFIPDDSAWSGDIPLIVHNSIIWLHTGRDVPWLSTAPMTGTLASGALQLIDVSFDASIPEIVQPGDYHAELVVASDTPYDSLTIPVTMTVAAPEDWGKLTGVITGLAYCDGPGNPLTGAQVEIAGAASTTSSDVGVYTYWLPAGSYDVTVSAGGYVTQQFTVEILPGETSQHDLDLRLDAPCTLGLPPELEVTVAHGYSYSVDFTILNTGAAGLSYQWLESPFDLAMGVQQSFRAAPGVLLPQAPSQGAASALSLAPVQARPAEIESPLSGWFGAADIPGGLVRYASAQCAEYPDSYFVFGGVDGSFNLTTKSWRYDAAANTWTQLAEMPSGGEAPAAACLMGRIYLMGGSGTTQFFAYDIGSDSWLYGPDLPRPVEGAAAAAWQGKLFLVGGDDDFYPYSGVSDRVDIFDLATGQWSEGAPMPVASGNAGFAQVGQYLYVVGGWGVSAPESNVNVTQRYNLAEGTWETGPEFTSARADFALAATTQALYAIGGDEDGNFFWDASLDFERLDLADWPDGAWQDTGDPLPVALSANNAGFCTSALMDADSAEVWSLGGSNPDGFIEGRASFNDRLGETCFSIYEDVSWLAADPVDASLMPNGEQLMIISLDAASLAVGEYRATLAYVSNDPGAAIVYLPVQMTIVEPTVLFFPLAMRP